MVELSVKYNTLVQFWLPVGGLSNFLGLKPTNILKDILESQWFKELVWKTKLNDSACNSRWVIKILILLTDNDWAIEQNEPVSSE